MFEMAYTTADNKTDWASFVQAVQLVIDSKTLQKADGELAGALGKMSIG